jgi:hypothetical protein
MNNLQEEIKRVKELMGLSEGLNLPKMTPESWFRSILMQTTGPFTHRHYPNSLFYLLDGKVIFEYDKKKIKIFGLIMMKFGHFLITNLIWNMRK